MNNEFVGLLEKRRHGLRRGRITTGFKDGRKSLVKNGGVQRDPFVVPHYSVSRSEHSRSHMSGLRLMHSGRKLEAGDKKVVRESDERIFFLAFDV